MQYMFFAAAVLTVLQAVLSFFWKNASDILEIWKANNRNPFIIPIRDGPIAFFFFKYKYLCFGTLQRQHFELNKAILKLLYRFMFCDLIFFFKAQCLFWCIHNYYQHYCATFPCGSDNCNWRLTPSVCCAVSLSSLSLSSRCCWLSALSPGWRWRRERRAADRKKGEWSHF